MATDVTDRLEEAIDEKLDAQFDATEQPADPCQCDGEITVKVEGITPVEDKPDAAKLLAEIEDAERDCANAELDWQQAKSAAKCAKDEYDDRVLRLRNLIRAARNDANRPLLNPTPAEEQPAASPDDAWQKTPLADLGLSPKILEAMEVARLRTVGELADYSRQYMLTDIKGIGPAKAEEIEDALTKFWAEHPEYTAPVAEEQSEEGDE